MRIGTPLLTCRSTTACGESTTRESISTPRFIGPGCMISVSGCKSRRAFDREAVGEGEFVEAGDEGAGTALALEAQESHDVGPGQRLVEVVHDGDRPRGHVIGQQRARRAQADLGAQGRVGRDVAARDPAVTDVADDEDPQSRRTTPLRDSRPVVSWRSSGPGGW